MLRKYLYGLAAFVLAVGILSVSILRSSLVNYAFAASKSSPAPTPQQIPEVDYVMTLPGKILPGSLLWPIKAARDRIWYIFTFGHLKKAELALFFSDKRLVSGQSLFEVNDSNLGLSTVTKGEKYLEMAVREEDLARKEGQDTSAFLIKLANASLKHWEIIEKSIIPGAPEEARPHLSRLLVYSRTAFTKASELLISNGKELPKNPFEGQ